MNKKDILDDYLLRLCMRLHSPIKRRLIKVIKKFLKEKINR